MHTLTKTISRPIALAFGAMLWLGTPTYAQAPAPTAPAPVAPSATAIAPAAPVPAGESNVATLHQACRKEAKDQGLKGLDMRKSVMACVIRQRPDLAGREQCRTDGFEKGLRGDELKTFVKDCAKGKA